MADFWRHSGYHLLRVREDGRLGVTDDFLRAYIERPEMRPVAESCTALGPDLGDGTALALHRFA